MHRAYWRRLAGIFCAAVAIAAAIPEPAAGYKIFGRWTSTKTDGGGLSRGDALTLTWSVVPDGESWSRGSNSNVIDFLDDAWGVNNRQADLTNRGWWSVMNRVYNQYERVSGLTMIYEPEQNADGSDTGRSGDIRIGGANIDGQAGGVLADNAYPNDGNMRIDTNRNGGFSWYYYNTTGLFNLIAHESGHGIGIQHDASSGRDFIMETPLNTNIFGLQFDDIYAMNRMYGDPREKNGGNDTRETATWLGNLETTGATDMGRHSENFSVNEYDGDWLGIDGNSDEDWFEIRITGRTSLDINVIPQGPEYSTEAQGNLDFAARADLNWSIHDVSGNQIMKVDRNESGSNERMYDLFLTAGYYYIRVDGEADNNQFYRINASANLIDDFDGYVRESLLLTDAFDVGDSGNVNFQRELLGRQIHSYYDSSWTDGNSLGGGDVGVSGERLRFDVSSDGDGQDEIAAASLMRNYGLQLEGEIWSVAFDLTVDGITRGALADFTLAIDDNDLSQGPAGEAPRLSVRFGADGDVEAVRRDGFVVAAGEFDVSDLRVQLVFDETQEQKTFDLLLNGELFVEDADVWFDDLKRYFSLDLTASSDLLSGTTSVAYLDNLTLEVLDAAFLPGDYNADGVVDAADYTVWRDNLGAEAGTLLNDADGGIIGAEQFATWRANFGTTVESALATTSAPEPTSLALLLAGGFLAGVRGRPRSGVRPA